MKYHQKRNLQQLETPPSNNTNLDPNAQVDFTPPTNPVVDPEPTKPFLSVEQMPQYPGGENALIAYLSKNIKYPPAATENSIEGPVVLQFVVNADGSISDITVLRPLEGGCTEEAIRVVRNMPRWAPGQQNGKSVPVYFTLPVTFQLTSQE
jgi:protein TonB